MAGLPQALPAGRCIDVIERCVARPDDGGDRTAGDDTAGGLGAGQCRFEIEHRLHGGTVGKQGGHAGIDKQVAVEPFSIEHCAGEPVLCERGMARAARRLH